MLQQEILDSVVVVVAGKDRLDTVVHIVAAVVATVVAATVVVATVAADTCR